jgi:CRISPR/Cas system-associated endoribonuclease Cas2
VLLTPLQVEKVKVELSSLIKAKEDTIAIYPVCKECFSKVEYFPKTRRNVVKKVCVV